MSVQTRSTALQNEIVRLYAQFEKDGRMANPAAQPLVEILDTDGATILDTVNAQMEHTGVWYVDWYVPANIPVGNYYDRWTFQWSASSSITEIVQTFSVYTLDSYINFISPGINYNISERVFQMLNDLANDYIYMAQHIPIYWEQAMRIQQENQQKRVKNYYYFTLDSDEYNATEGAVYFNNGQKFTVLRTMVPTLSTSSSSTSISSSSESIGNVSTSSSSIDSHSSNSSPSSSSQSLSSESSDNLNSSSSSETIPVTTTTTTWVYKEILGCVGTGVPSNSGTLVKVSGAGDASIGYVSYTSQMARLSTIYSLAYGNWNRDPRPKVRLNNRIVDDGWYVDWNGKIYFDRLMAPEDNVYVAYDFAFFKPEELMAFLDLGLKTMNTVPPASVTYPNVVSMPFEWDAPVLLFAGMTAIRRLIFDLNFQEKWVIFSRPENMEATQQFIQNLKDLLTAYEASWLEMSKNVKTRKLPGIAMSVTPEYSLPGGRCLAFDTLIDCKIDNDVKQFLTIKDLFSLFDNGKEISVLSNVGKNKVDYVSVGNIWNSGNKLTYFVRTKDTEIRATEEHLIYVVNKKKFVPVKEMSVEDYVLVLKNGKLIKQKLIADPEENCIEEVYDMEIPETENFIGNNIKLHNSRWFRYLYKTN